MPDTEWTTDRVLLAPTEAARLLNERAELNKRSNRRIQDLLEANDRYLARAREAEAALARRPADQPLTGAALADALACFWNAAIADAHNRQSGTSMDVASVMASGLAAVARRLEGED